MKIEVVLNFLCVEVEIFFNFFFNIIPISDCYSIELLLRFDNNTTTLLNMSRISDEVAVNTSVGLECKSQHRLVSVILM